MILIVLIIIRGPAEKQIMEPEEAVTEPDDEVYGCLSSEDSPHMSDEDKELQRLINEKKKDRTYRVGYPTRSEKPVSEWNNEKIFCLAFPWLYPGGFGDFKGIRNTPINPSEWAENLLYYEDGRFARDKLWCFFHIKLSISQEEPRTEQFLLPKHPWR